jgi:hypothetical protein
MVSPADSPSRTVCTGRAASPGRGTPSSGGTPPGRGRKSAGGNHAGVLGDAAKATSQGMLQGKEAPCGILLTGCHSVLSSAGGEAAGIWCGLQVQPRGSNQPGRWWCRQAAGGGRRPRGRTSSAAGGEARSGCTGDRRRQADAKYRARHHCYQLTRFFASGWELRAAGEAAKRIPGLGAGASGWRLAALPPVRCLL